MCCFTTHAGSPTVCLCTPDVICEPWLAVHVVPHTQVIESLFTSYFASHNLPFELNDFDGRSDYEGFIEANIPCACLDIFVTPS